MPDATPSDPTGPGAKAAAAARAPANAPVTPPARARRPAPTRRPSFAHRGLRWVGRRFPVETSEPRTESGFAADVPRTWPFTVLALAVAAGFAGLWLWVAQTYPLPPGEDPATWLLTSYAYVGLPHASVTSLYGYPPASFPVLGLSVLAGGGPLLGARIYTSGAIIVLGFATYHLGRTLLQRPSLAVVAEGLLLAEPHFEQIYYFGGYPNLFALICATFAVGFFVRYLRDRRPLHLYAFWLGVTLTVLSHSLTAAILAATIVFLFAALLIVGRFPRAVFASRAGGLGLLTLFGGLGAYYGVTQLSGIGHPTYLQANSATASSSLLPSALQPFYLSSAWDYLTNTNPQLSSGQALAFILIASGFMLVAFLYLRIRRPSYLTTPWLVLEASFLAAFAGIVAGLVLGITTDYRRYQYFLYTPAILLPLYVFDILLSGARPATEPRPTPVREPVVPNGRRRLTSAERRNGQLDVVIAFLTVLLLLGVAQNFTLPNAQTYETYYGKIGHDRDFLAAMNAITNSGIDGNILSSTIFTGHWPSAVTGTRITYVVSFLAGNSQQYTATQVYDAELTSLTLGERYSTTNSYLVGSVPGLAQGNFNSTADIGAFTFDVYRQLIRLPSSTITIGFPNGTTVVIAPSNTSGPAVVPSVDGFGYSLEFVTHWANVTETVRMGVGSPSATITLSATATAGVPIAYLSARLTGFTGGRFNVIPGSVADSFVWNTTSRTGNLSTFGNVTPAGALAKITPFTNASGVPATVLLRASAPNASVGAASLALAVNVTTPGLVNVFPRPIGWISSDQLWTQWAARFVMTYNGSGQGGIPLDIYLQSEYAASTFDVHGPWTVLLLPTFPGASASTLDPASMPTGPPDPGDLSGRR